MEKKKLIRIKPRKDSSPDTYRYSNMHFAFVSNPVNERTQCTDLMACRENVNNILHLAKSKESNSAHDYVEDAPIDFEKLRLLLVQDSDESYDVFKAKLFSGKALLNRYEEKAGWTHSKIATVKHPYYENAWLLTGPKEWMSQPQLLSIVTLFMRLMAIHGPLNVDTTFQQAEDDLRLLYANYMNSFKNKKENMVFNYYPDIGLYLKYIDDIRLLITNTKKIFSSIELEEAWAQSDKGLYFGVYSGILSFFGEKTFDYNKSMPIVRNNFIKLKNTTLTENKNHETP